MSSKEEAGKIKDMNPRHLYAYEKFTSALGTLAVGPGNVRTRLRAAYYHIYSVREEHLPNHLHTDYEWILQQLLRYDPVTDRDGNIIRGSLDETLGRIRNSTGVKIAERILRIYHQLNWLNMEGEQES
jgi:hypothetical protein